MSLETTILHLTAHIEALQVAVNTLTAAMETLTATATVEIESRTDRPMLEVIKTTSPQYADEMKKAGFSSGPKRRGRPAGIREQTPRAICRSSCCGAEGRHMSKDDGRCYACR